MVGLLENTSGNNRYMGYLRRPLPLDLLFGLSVGREDTLNSQRIRLGLGRFGFAPMLAFEKPRTLVEASTSSSLDVSGAS